MVGQRPGVFRHGAVRPLTSDPHGPQPDPVGRPQQVARPGVQAGLRRGAGPTALRRAVPAGGGDSVLRYDDQDAVGHRGALPGDVEHLGPGRRMASCSQRVERGTRAVGVPVGQLVDALGQQEVGERVSVVVQSLQLPLHVGVLFTVQGRDEGAVAPQMRHHRVDAPLDQGVAVGHVVGGNGFLGAGRIMVDGLQRREPAQRGDHSIEFQG